MAQHHQFVSSGPWFVLVNFDIGQIFTWIILVGTVLVALSYAKSQLFGFPPETSPLMIFGGQLWDHDSEYGPNSVQHRPDTVAAYMTYTTPPSLYEECSEYEWQQSSCSDTDTDFTSFTMKSTENSPVSSKHNSPISSSRHLPNSRSRNETEDSSESVIVDPSTTSESSDSISSTDSDVAEKQLFTSSDHNQRLFDQYRTMNARDSGWTSFQKKTPESYSTLGGLLNYAWHLNVFVRDIVRRSEQLESRILNHWKGVKSLRTKYEDLVSSFSGIENRYVLDIIMTTYQENVAHKADEQEFCRAFNLISTRLEEAALIFGEQDYPTLVSPQYDDVVSEEHILRTVEFEVANYNRQWRHYIFSTRADLSVSQFNASFILFSGLYMNKAHHCHEITKSEQRFISKQLKCLKLATQDWDVRLRTLRQQSENIMWSIEGYKFTYSRLISELQAAYQRINSSPRRFTMMQYKEWLKQFDVDNRLENLCQPVVTEFMHRSPISAVNRHIEA